MSTEGPVSLWIEGLCNADEIAADKLWRHYVRRLLQVARAKLRPDTRKVYDEQDAAVSAFHSLCVGITEGRFPDLNDRVKSVESFADHHLAKGFESPSL